MPRRFVPMTLALLAVLALPILTGCDSSQDKNKRAELAAKRKLAARKPVVVNSPNAAIDVSDLQAVGKGKNALIVVGLTNTGKEILTDLPISIGVKQDGRTKLLNKGPDLYYFANHVPALAPGKATIWIGEFNKRIPKGKLVARVGQPTFDQLPGVTMPDLKVSVIASGKGEVTGSLENKSGVPQYVVQLYAVARTKGRWTAAGRTVTVKVTGDDSRDFVIPMQGSPKRAAPELSAAPAILKPAE